MTKRQKQILAAMAIVMVLILGAIAFSFYQKDSEAKLADFQAQIDAQVHEVDVKATNRALTH